MSQIMGVFAVFDRKAEYYLPLFTARTDVDAVRAFGEMVTMSDLPIAKFPADYDVCRLGEVDLEAGLVSPLVPVRVLRNGLSVLEEAQRERERYRRFVSQPQMDVEEFTGSGDVS